ncbi:hypothetical protein 7AX4_7 [uncultured Caudovirales phage]|uniref:Uncharacterized protein n=1 Tax=uncultured Caudovirales phage TaxID=2100421 RepID=A0A2H4JB28_9CAUD|nr:hypothetical protein 7AX4_7 [uncultured Caudovirales phage]
MNSVTCSIFFSQKKEPHGSVKKSLCLFDSTSAQLSPATDQTLLHSRPDYPIERYRIDGGMSGTGKQ